MKAILDYKILIALFKQQDLHAPKAVNINLKIYYSISLKRNKRRFTV